jgi:hypothetical protein
MDDFIIMDEFIFGWCLMCICIHINRIIIYFIPVFVLYFITTNPLCLLPPAPLE